MDPLVDFKWWLTDEEEEEDINYYNNKRGIQVGNREDGPVLNQNRQSASGTNQTRRRHRQPSLRGGHRNFSAGNRGTSSQDKFNNRLIFDDGDMHTAAEMCASESSRGPDFVNVDEGLFCRMSDKTLFPICGTGVEDGCWGGAGFKVKV